MKRKLLSGLLALSLILSLSVQAYAVGSIYASDIVSIANELSGKYPYVSGGRSPSNGGFDCTGLVYYIYHTRLGYDMTVEQSVSKSKLLAMGTKITNKADLLPGDIIQYTISHVGIYIGNNSVIHAGSSKGVVKIPLTVNGLTFSYGIRLPNVIQGDGSNSSGNNSTSSAPTDNQPKLTITYADCNVGISCVDGQTVNLYNNPGDTSRVTYFSKGQTVRSIYCATLSDGSTWYRVTASHQGDTNRTFWLKYESSKMTVTPVKVVHTVNFNANGGSVSTTYKQVTAGETYGDLPTPTRSGYTFDGWYTATNGGTKITSSTTVDLSSDQITLYAHWSSSTLIITFDANGGLVSPAQKTISAGSTYGELPYPTNGDLGFEGWYTAPSGGTYISANSYLISNSDHTLYAHWADIYHATLDPNGGTVQGSTSPIRSEYRANSNLPVATRPGYTFDGWYTEKTGGSKIVSGEWIRFREGAYFYAHWTPVEAGSYVVTFDSQGGDQVDSIEVQSGGTYGKLPHCFGPNFGDAFLGWYTSPTGGRQVKEGDPIVVNADHTLYAHYKRNLYLIIFDPNGGTVARQFTEDMSKSKQFYYVGANADGYGDLPKAAWDGYEFLGWYTDPVGGTQIVKGMRYIVEDDHTLYAHWR